MSVRYDIDSIGARPKTRPVGFPCFRRTTGAESAIGEQTHKPSARSLRSSNYIAIHMN